MWWHTEGFSERPASDLGWGSSTKTAPESLSTGSPAGLTPPHGEGSMCSQANVRAGKWLRPLHRALPSVIVDTEKVLREADGPVEKWLHRESASGGKVFAPGCASKAGRVRRWGARRTQAVKQERRIDDYWNIDGSRDLSESWSGFTQFTLLSENSPDGYMWSGRRLTRQQVTSRPDHFWPELWIKLGRNAKLKE